MKKLLAMALAVTTLSGCHYLGEPEAYTIVDEERAPMAQPVVAPAPMPAPAPVVRPMVVPAAPAPSCGCQMGQSACQINPGVSGPIMITIPASTVCIQ